MVSDVPNGKKIPSELKTKLERHGQMVGVSREGWGWVKIPPMLLLMQCPWLCLSFPIVKVGAICLCWEKGVAGWHWGFGYPHVQRPVPETSLDKPVPGGGGAAQLGSSARTWRQVGEGVLWVWCMGEAMNVDFYAKSAALG